MKMLSTAIVVAAVVLTAMVQRAQAAFTDTLADLTSATGNYSSLSIGDKTFSDFSYSDSGLTGFDPTQITVTASIDNNGVYFLTWSSGPIATLNATADLKLNYSVTASAGVIDMIDQGYTGSGIIKVDETVSTSSGGVPIVGQSHLDAYDMSDPPAEATDVLNIVPPESTLYVTKDISLSTLSITNFATISQVEQSFHQVPEASTVFAGILLLLPLGASSLRILRRSRIA